MCFALRKGWDGQEAVHFGSALKDVPPCASHYGRGGIRTHGEFYPTLDFESSALDRAQPPFLEVAREGCDKHNLPFIMRLLSFEARKFEWLPVAGARK